MKLVSRYDSDTYCENGEIFSLECGHEYEYIDFQSTIVVIGEGGICKNFEMRTFYNLFYSEKELRKLKLERILNGRERV